MRSETAALMEAMIYFVPFMVFLVLNNAVNVKRENRYRQYPIGYSFITLKIAAGLL